MKFKIKNRGYTLMELLVVVAIVSIMSAIVLANYGTSREGVVLKQAASHVIMDLRMAQNMAMNTTKFSGQIPEGGYGVHFNASPSGSYVVYADLDGNGIYTDAGERFAARNLDSRVSIISATASDIGFIPPEPKICIDAKSPVSASWCAAGVLAPVFSSAITLRYGAGGAVKTINVNGITGQITGN